MNLENNPNNYTFNTMVKIDGNEEEQKYIKSALQISFTYLDKFFDGKFVEIFKGLQIEVGDGLTESGGEAFAEENRIVLDRSKMMLSIREADEVIAEAGMALVGDRLSAVPEELTDTSVAVYELVHEIGHIIEGSADRNLPIKERYKRAEGLTDKSPSHLYLQDPNKPHEAFAEAFAHMVYGKEVDVLLQAVVNQAIIELE